MFSFMMGKKMLPQAAYKLDMQAKGPKTEKAHTPTATRAKKLPQRKATHPRKWSASLGHGGPFFPFY